MTARHCAWAFDLLSEVKQWAAEWCDTALTLCLVQRALRRAARCSPIAASRQVTSLRPPQWRHSFKQSAQQLLWQYSNSGRTSLQIEPYQVLFQSFVTRCDSKPRPLEAQQSFDSHWPTWKSYHCAELKSVFTYCYYQLSGRRVW